MIHDSARILQLANKDVTQPSGFGLGSRFFRVAGHLEVEVADEIDAANSALGSGDLGNYDLAHQIEVGLDLFRSVHFQVTKLC